jgi:GAF domain
MSDFASALDQIRRHGEGLLTDAADMLRQLVREACAALSASEGSILIPREGRNELEFFVSINPALDGSKLTVACDSSVSGFVYLTRQAIAKIKPDSLGSTTVDEIAHSQTEFLLAVPIVDDERVYGVATFVNRVGDKADIPFSAQDLLDAQAYGEIYSTAMKLYRQIESSTAMASRELTEHSAALGLTDCSEAVDISEDQGRWIPAQVADNVSSLPIRQQTLLLKISELVASHCGEGGDQGYGREPEIYDL